MKFEKDYKKWVLFNSQLHDFRKLYELYTAVGSMQSNRGISIEENTEGDKNFYTIKQEGYSVVLYIHGESDKRLFLSYLDQHFLAGKSIEEWYRMRLQEADKKENHASVEDFKSNKFITIQDLKIHPKEERYYKWRVFLSSCIYILLIGLLANAFLKSVAFGAIVLAVAIGAVLFFGLLRRAVQGFFIGVIKGNAVKLNEYQYPEIHEVVKDQANAIGLDEVPEVYILHGDFNAFVTKFAKKKFLILHSEVLETTLQGDVEVLKFIVGHELAHIKRKHLNQERWLWPTSFIPFLKQAHSRGSEYTCDRVGYHFSNKGAMEGILILATGKEIYSKINVGRYIEDADKDKDFWVWLSEKFSSHPHTYKRLKSVKAYAQTVF